MLIAVHLVSGTNMLIAWLGSTGMGLMWGWLLILFGGRGPLRRPLVNTLVLGLATLLFALQLFWFTDGQALVFFLLATTISSALHLAWRRSLRADN
jgi:hypothetical protein